jgi:hypothetical protein
MHSQNYKLTPAPSEIASQFPPPPLKFESFLSYVSNQVAAGSFTIRKPVGFRKGSLNEKAWPEYEIIFPFEGIKNNFLNAKHTAELMEKHCVKASGSLYYLASLLANPPWATMHQAALKS